MKVHEYQAKGILARSGVPIPKGRVVGNPEDAYHAARELGGRVVIKAQVHAGGRGKAGGIQLAQTPEEAEAKAGRMLGSSLVTYQTGGRGVVVKRVLVEEVVPLLRELYLGAVLDRALSRVVVMASTEGGVEIEETATRSPEKIFKEWADPFIGLADFQTRRLAMRLSSDRAIIRQLAGVISGVYAAFLANDASMVEINPLVITDDGRVMALDAKMSFDDSALYRRADVAQMRDPAEEDSLEEEARTQGLSFVRLDGNIGCVVNGAGLAMATMDIVKYFGGSPANFLDIGGSSSPEKVLAAMRVLLADPRVKTVLFNIFGGITRCDDVATGMVQALREIGTPLPVVVRLTGTNEEEGRRILQEVGLEVGSSMEEAVKKAVAKAAEQGGTI
ncbi:MAG: ADP-forming succinate--CoA ligase subunit beta [Candidatus Eisenbacteria bacterium]|jgi:succinyl-CoA synthetase beta subunit|nr:ADP-forming succinate--CoA ligase subunit beta [Candidatus Eisenbacteria bacterium]